MLNSAMLDFLTVDATPKRAKAFEIFHMIRRTRPLWRIGKDMVGALRAFM
jgi:hypothetical protein